MSRSLTSAEHLRSKYFNQLILIKLVVFNSFNFWLIFPFIFVIYWAIPIKFNRARNLFLLVVSYLLYMNWKPSFAIVLFVVTVICWWGGACAQ